MHICAAILPSSQCQISNMWNLDLSLIQSLWQSLLKNVQSEITEVVIIPSGSLDVMESDDSWTTLQLFKISYFVTEAQPKICYFVTEELKTVEREDV